MTEYAIEGHRLLACWRGVRSGAAAAVAELPSDPTPGRTGRDLTAMLTDLSRAVWAEYARPETVERPGPLDDETERPGDTAILEAIRSPGEPRLHDSGRIRLADRDAEDHAHWIGRFLRSFADTELTEAVLLEARVELDAVRRAGKGDLAGRAEQAVHLDRTAVAPLQVATADQLLSADPLSDPEEFAALDPAAAAVAAAHWLHCAATVVADECCLDVDDAVAEAGLVHPVSHEVPTLVLARLETGHRPADVVLDLIAEALLVREGRLPSLAALQHRVADRLDALERHAACDPRVTRPLTRMRLTHLDPARPARNLLAGLLEGIRSCASLYVQNLTETDAAESTAGEVESLTEDWVHATRTEVRKTRYRLY